MFEPDRYCIVVVGAQWGDEGKGKIVDVVAERADLVVLDRNLFAIDSYEISDAYVTMTIFDGRTVYTRTE